MANAASGDGAAGHEARHAPASFESGDSATEDRMQRPTEGR